MKGKQLRIMINGFYGAGNSGDEAMLRNFVYNIRKRYEDCMILVATDKKQSFICKDVYFISSEDRSQLEETDVYVLGGGDLPPAFGSQLLIHAKKANNKCIMMGVSINDLWMDENLRTIHVDLLKLFDVIYVRDVKSSENLKVLGIEHRLGTDIAFDLPTQPIEFTKSDKHVSLCIREVRREHQESMMSLSDKVVRHLLNEGYTITLLPFCYEDKLHYEGFMKIDPKRVKQVWTLNPEQHKHVIANSDFVISIGRLHPLIYATSTATPMLGMIYPQRKETQNYRKMFAWMDYIGSSFILPFEVIDKTYVKKFEELVRRKDEIKGHLASQAQVHNKILKKEFDEIVGLMKDA